MEPPLNGGNTHQLGDGLAGVDTAAMGPELNGARRCTAGTGPSSRCRSSGRRNRARRLNDGISPALSQRSVTVEGRFRNGAAAERRGHALGIVAVGAESRPQPQWSPPSDGGSTRRGRPAGRVMPQWSPPLNGGSTCTLPPTRAATLAAMEPAVERREHLLVARAAAAAYLAAMEPAVERREHRRHAWTCHGTHGAAMEPAVERREHPSCLAPMATGTSLPQWSPPSNGGSTQLTQGAGLD